MVFADHGVIYVDEFDKMSVINGTAIHEVMKQGRVTIAKGGVHTSLNAHYSILAAANSVYGRYNQYIPPMENIRLQDSLFSRFDLRFVMLDVRDSDQDQVISNHVVRVDKYKNAIEQDNEVLALNSDVDILNTKNPDAENPEDVAESDVARTQQITVRTSKTLIRLAKNVSDLVQFAYFKRVLEKEKRQGQRPDS
ncbi:DNA replication licensing factor Mcm3-like [Venturia canescens]|uniref:DNA replication licensing factor Mcm3-like n=1 Tax=Venturia canescens TaxID=32260 RepID=UPI001C9C83DA|nr:DNA replication licensing factor Mcm3-like [Venturia canescens]